MGVFGAEHERAHPPAPAMKFSLCGMSRHEQRRNFMPRGGIKLNSSARPARSQQESGDQVHLRTHVLLQKPYNVLLALISVFGYSGFNWILLRWGKACDLHLKKVLPYICPRFVPLLASNCTEGAAGSTARCCNLKRPHRNPQVLYSDLCYMDTKLWWNSAAGNISLSSHLHLPVCKVALTCNAWRETQKRPNILLIKIS